jgi:hypothetical protein
MPLQSGPRVTRGTNCMWFVLVIGLSALTSLTHASKTQATMYLDKLLGSSGIPSGTEMTAHLDKQKFESTTPCKNKTCVFETSIQLLPDSIYNSLLMHQAGAAQEMLELEIRRRSLLSTVDEQSYLSFSPANAVDDDPTTVFKSLYRK